MFAKKATECWIKQHFMGAGMFANVAIKGIKFPKLSFAPVSQRPLAETVENVTADFKGHRVSQK